MKSIKVTILGKQYPLKVEDSEEENMIAEATARAEALGAQPGGPAIQVPMTPSVEVSEIL